VAEHDGAADRADYEPHDQASICSAHGCLLSLRTRAYPMV
jgi:hypothetical protein